MSFKLSGFALIAVGVFGPLANAHHSFPVHFVPDKLVTISGVVSEFRFSNPHALIFVDVEGDDGVSAQWRVETNSPSVLRRRGWSADAIEAGDEVTIEGYPTRDGSNAMRVYRLTFADGREMIGQRPSSGVADLEN